MPKLWDELPYILNDIVGPTVMISKHKCPSSSPFNSNVVFRLNLKSGKQLKEPNWKQRSQILNVAYQWCQQTETETMSFFKSRAIWWWNTEGCEPGITVRAEHSLRVLQNKVQRRIFRPKREKVTEHKGYTYWSDYIKEGEMLWQTERNKCVQNS